MKVINWLVIPLFFLLGACHSIPPEERREVRKQINTDADEIIARMIKEEPGFQKRLDASVGYFASRISDAKVLLVGGGYGVGVLYDKKSGSRTYMNVHQADIGAGLAAKRFSGVILFETRDALKKIRSGTWMGGVGADSSLGTHGAEGNLVLNEEGYSVHVLSDSGGGATLSARLVRLSVNADLTGSGVSEVSIPNTKFKKIDDPGNTAPRIWEHKMPFMAQQVIDEGYDLPLPYGIALVYANVKQEMFLTNLKAGINGSPQRPWPVASLENVHANNETVQVKLDTWVFPFMNVFAMLGSISGDAPLDVVLDINGNGRPITFPINAKFSGISYGLGTTLAGGWRNWFVAIPMAATAADMDGTNADGLSYTVTPRFGRVVNLGRGGNLALFVGGNYLKTALTITGQVSAEGVTIDYTIDQENADPWNLLMGFNWDVGKRLSWSLEYDGFIGSREAVITSLAWRF